MTAEQMMSVNGAELCVQTFGDQADPAILLIAGATCSMDWWDERFCALLADGGRFVIRYDLRDTGRSTKCPPGEPDYTLDDLTGDAIGLLEAFGLTGSHLVGTSMGGMIAQRIAVRRPELLGSLTLLSSTPGRMGDASLPPIADRLIAYASQLSGPPDWDDRQAVIDYLFGAQTVMAGPDSFDGEWTRETAARCFDRTDSMAASQNHPLLLGVDAPREQLGMITLPTLVLHGTEDPLFPYGHAEALHAEIPGSTLIPLDGIGHQPPPPALWQLLATTILDHTSR